MSYLSFGQTLREARERQGLDISAVSRELRLRPDILRAIEDGDFSRMPQEGFSRNMVIAYARLLGLNSGEIVRMYDDESHRNRVGGTRTASSTSRSSNSSSLTRGLGRSSSTRPRRTEQGVSSSTQYTNFYSGPQAANPLMSKLPIIIAGVIIVILLIVVLVLAFGSRTATTTTSTDTPKVAITGVTDTSQTSASESSDSSQSTQKLVAPTSVEVSYKLQSDDYEQLNVIISNDGDEEESMMKVPSSGTATVTGTWSFACWSVDSVTVTVDGEEVEQSGTNDEGMPIWIVNFSDYLAKWNEEHPGASASTTTSSSSATDSSSSSSSNSSSIDTGSSSSSTRSTSSNSSTGTTSSTSSSSSGSSSGSSSSRSSSASIEDDEDYSSSYYDDSYDDSYSSSLDEDY